MTGSTTINNARPAVAHAGTSGAPASNETPAAASQPSAQLSGPPELQSRQATARSHAHHSHSARFHRPPPPQSDEARPMWASARFCGSGSSPLLPASLGRSDDFAPETAQAAASVPPQAVVAAAEVELQTSTSAVPEVVIDIEPPPQPPATPRAQIEAALGRMEFAAPEGPLREAQQALEHEYIGWAAGVAGKRQAIFGEGRYSIGEDHRKSFGEAVLPATYDFARQFISSSSRSPMRNAIATALAPSYTEIGGQRVNVGEFSNGWDSSVVGGAVGGVTAHAVDSTLLTAMDREARQANMPQFKPVDLKALVPDPAEVQLSIVDGKKVYWRLGEDAHADIETGAAMAEGRPTKAQLQEEVKVRRQALASVQDGLEAKNWGLFAQPLVTGAFNVLRRVVMPASSLLQPGPVFVGSVLASGTAGAVTKAGLGMLKPLAQAKVDDLVGGTQHVNLFATKLPDASQEPARFSDIANLPGRAASALRETAALGAQFVAGPWRDSGSWMPSRDASLARIGDVARAVTANTLASVLSTATGPLVASVARQGLTVPMDHEAKDSGAYLLQQAATSATNDYVWQASREAHKNSVFDLAGSLDRWRERTGHPHGE